MNNRDWKSKRQPAIEKQNNDGITTCPACQTRYTFITERFNCMCLTDNIPACLKYLDNSDELFLSVIR